jgi:hypothetical protein
MDLCDLCKHYQGDRKCDAFPEGIPTEIWWWGYDHRLSFPGDNGIRFEFRVDCKLCTYYLKDGKCTVYPRGIPLEIWAGKEKHDKPYPGDGGHIFKIRKNIWNNILRDRRIKWREWQSMTEEEREEERRRDKEDEGKIFY